MIAQDSGNRGDESRIAGFLCRLEATRGDPLAAFEYFAVAIRNYHDAGNATSLRPSLASSLPFSTGSDVMSQQLPSRGSRWSVPSPPTWNLEISTTIAHLRDVLGDETYESLARTGETMTTAAMATYAYEQIDLARAELNAVSK